MEPIELARPPIAQQPDYKNQQHLESCLRKIHSLPPLVHHSEIMTLKAALAEVTPRNAECSTHSASLFLSSAF
jgi:3-deoxy-D-arabino-heptulosonate 7-phosphate (DAHP) synthase class II